MITEFQITTPALLFSTVSLIMLAYTNRFLALAKLIRDLHDKYMDKPEKLVLIQIQMLHKRVKLVKQMQFLCVSALFISVISMLFIVYEFSVIASITFVIALILLSLSLALSVYEIMISTHALNFALNDMKTQLETKQKKNLINKLMAKFQLN